MKLNFPEFRTILPVHIVARTNNQVPFGPDLPKIWKVFADQCWFISHAFKVEICAFVMMSNHIHMIINPKGQELGPIMRWFMLETSRGVAFQTRNKNHLWGNRYHSSWIDDPLYALNALRYVYQNPTRAGLCESILDYPFSSLQGVLGISAYQIPISGIPNLWSPNSSDNFFENPLDLVQHCERDFDIPIEHIRCGLKHELFEIPKAKSKVTNPREYSSVY